MVKKVRDLAWWHSEWRGEDSMKSEAPSTQKIQSQAIESNLRNENGNGSMRQLENI